MFTYFTVLRRKGVTYVFKNGGNSVFVFPVYTNFLHGYPTTSYMLYRCMYIHLSWDDMKSSRIRKAKLNNIKVGRLHIDIVCVIYAYTQAVIHVIHTTPFLFGKLVYVIRIFIKKQK